MTRLNLINEDIEGLKIVTEDYIRLTRIQQDKNIVDRFQDVDYTEICNKVLAEINQSNKTPGGTS